VLVERDVGLAAPPFRVTRRIGPVEVVGQVRERVPVVPVLKVMNNVGS
jgi:hypothetical protein